MDSRSNYIINNKERVISYSKRWIQPQEMDDFYQELVLSSLKEKDPPDNTDITAYSLRFVSFRAKDWLKKRKKQSERCTIADSERILQEEDYRQNEQDFLQNDKLHLALRRAMQRIEEFDRELVKAWLTGINITELTKKYGSKKSHGHWRLKKIKAVIMDEYIRIGRE